MRYYWYYYYCCYYYYYHYYYYYYYYFYFYFYYYSYDYYYDDDDDYYYYSYVLLRRRLLLLLLLMIARLWELRGQHRLRTPRIGNAGDPSSNADTLLCCSIATAGSESLTHTAHRQCWGPKQQCGYIVVLQHRYRGFRIAYAHRA